MPLARFPLLTLALVLASLVAYVLSVLDGGSFVHGPSAQVALAHGAVPNELDAEGVFLAPFLHGSLPQLLADLLALAIFAPNVEDAMGRVRFLAFYLLGGILALGLLILLAPNSHVPALGAVGAVAWVLGGYLALYPRARVISLVPIPFFATIVEVPAILLLGAWLLVQVWFGLADLTGPLERDWGITFGVHLGAFLLGVFAIRLFAQRELLARKRPPLRPVY
ncbi:MAG TPA: rhomboid family intramembrane serine protease [Solirubrobacteraceae bacterium]|nr:rhomboid family intramembrane serine protease [Solirubrobacteraceae bacterium]